MPALLVRRFGALAVAALLVVGLLPAAVSPVRAASPTELFFSEYIEGSSNNKALEIYNGTGAAVNLATGGYNVQMFFNGSATAGLTINLTGTVANGDVFVIAQSSANATILAQADQTNGSGWFNGDDAAVLRKGTTVIDAIGQIGLDPGTEWGASLTSTADNTLRRKAAIGTGDTNSTDAFDPSIEWDGYATDTFGGLGSHAYVPPDPVINEFSASTTGTDVEYVEIYGAASTSYAAYTILEIEGDTGAAVGTIDEVISLGTTGANRLYLVNLAANALENGTITLLLVRGFSGALNADLDTNNDGTFDTTPWSAIVDAVAVNDGGAGDLTYGVPSLGVAYDGQPFAPGGASRIPDGVDTDTADDWVRNDFDLAGIPGFIGTLVAGEALNTPGAPNSTVVPEVAPFVASTTPGAGATDVAVDANITLTFSEPVNVGGTWFTITCAAGGPVAALASGGPTTFTLNPTANLPVSDTCTVTIAAAGVSDQDTSDPPDNMAADHVWSFTMAAVDPCTLPFTPIYAIQGTGAAAAITGPVVAQGIVVGDFEGPSPALRGFYLQDLVGDADAATSDGIFVFNGNIDSVSLGDVVRVAGSAAEFQGQTQISSVSTIAGCANGESIAPTDVTFPVASSDYLERFEGMLVRLPQTMFVTEHFQLGRFGQVVLSSGGRLAQPTNVVDPGAPALALQAANNLNRIILDDALQSQNPDPIVFARGGLPLSASNTLRGGDTATNIVGVMTYTWSGDSASGNAYRLRPINALNGYATFEPTNPRPTSAPDVGGTLTVVGMNYLNYFNSFTGCTNGVGGSATDCRGAGNATEFDRQWPKLVEAILSMNPDILGFTEMENDGYGSSSAIATLVGQLNAETAPGTYAFIDADAATGQVNALGADAIKVGLIYKPGTVTPVGQTAALNSVEFVNGGDGAPRNRPALAQAFEENDTGARFIAVVNHLKSKGSACDTADAGDGQGNCNEVRVNAATELVGWLAGDPTGVGDPDVLLVGDYNAYAKEDPIRVFETADFTNLVEQFGGPTAYSYVFDGQWGYLDQGLGSASILGRVTGTAEYHINADEPSVLDYNTEFKTAGQILSLYAPDEFRVSDHDPIVVGLDLGIDTTTTLTVTPTSQQYSDKVTLSAAITPSEATGSIRFQVSTDNGSTYTNVGSTVPVVDGVASLADPQQVLVAAGAPLRFRAVFDGTNDYMDSSGTQDVTVTKEDASILYDPANLVAIQVAAPGDPSWTGTLRLAIGVKEREPDSAGTGSPGLGDITLAGLSARLVPLLGGGTLNLACAPNTPIGTGYAKTVPFTCEYTGPIPLGTYEVVLDVTGGYYTGTYGDAFTVYDPSLGFATGGGRFVYEGDDVTFGFVMKYTKKLTNLKGSFIAVRHHDDGTVTRLKSNALGGLAILDSGGCGIATFNGKATYTTWDPAANGGYGAYATVGNQAFAVRADDCGTPGIGTDTMWVRGPGLLAMPSPASLPANRATLTGGNIAVPHTPAER